MGNSQSQQTQTNIRNAINTEIENCTNFINIFVNSSTIQALNNLISNNKLILSSSCNSANNFTMANCNVTGGKINVVQNLTQACVGDMMAKIVEDTTWQQKFSTELKSIFAQSIQNNNELMQAIDAKTTLMLIDPNIDLQNAIVLIMNVLNNGNGEMEMEAMTGTNITTDVITNITNQFNNNFSKRTYSEHDINYIKNIINSNTVSLSDCKLTTDGLNTAVMTNCNNDDNVMVLNQTAAIQSLQLCSQGVINTILVTLLNIYRTNINMPTKEYKENFQHMGEVIIEKQNGGATTQACSATPLTPSLINHYNKYKKTYITIIILLLLLVLAIILIITENANTMSTTPVYQLTATPSMQSEM